MTQKLCPTCGQAWPNHNSDAHRRAAIRALLSGQGYQEQQAQPMAMGATIAGSLPAGATWERREPSRTAEMSGDVLVPLAQSGVTAVVGGVVGLLVAGPVAAGVAGGLAFGASWLLLLADHRRALWMVEKISGVDLDNDGQVGDPGQAKRVRVEVVENNGRQARILYVDLPDSVNDIDTLTDVARALLVDGANLSRDGLSSVLSQPQYNALAPALVDAGLAVRLRGNRRELSAAGRAMFRELLAND